MNSAISLSVSEGFPSRQPGYLTQRSSEPLPEITTLPTTIAETYAGTNFSAYGGDSSGRSDFNADKPNPPILCMIYQQGKRGEVTFRFSRIERAEQPK